MASEVILVILASPGIPLYRLKGVQEEKYGMIPDKKSRVFSCTDILRPYFYVKR